MVAKGTAGVVYKLDAAGQEDSAVHFYGRDQWGQPPMQV